MQGSNWSTFSNTVNFDILSAKQLIGQCIDMAATALQQAIAHYCQSTNTDFPSNPKNDLSQYVSYILDPARFDRFVEYFVKVDLLSKKQFIKTWINQLRSIRNAWAHWAPENLDKRLAFRGFETLSLVFIVLGGNQTTPLFNSIEMYRRRLLIDLAQKEFLEQQRQQQQQQQQQNQKLFRPQ